MNDLKENLAFKFSIEQNLINRKPLLILGKPYTGKSLLCDIIARTFTNEEIMYINGFVPHNFNIPCALQAATKDTKIIVIDDFILSLDQLFNFLSDYYYDGKGLLVNKRGESPFYIKPAIIINTNILSLEQFNDLGESIKRRFNAIEL
ncbi:hypothetical protein LX95_01279 [Mesonia algae]|uniref:Uncharacterized protein n=1 Tax=Mesonia algae TaxID=213248 RepID=A0A2W7I5Z5_9FLAO|nr:hypothetical protein [Mesonia algae]PZW41598.1 hypothetical protein LX95_01279 [Mesonia algae]